MTAPRFVGFGATRPAPRPSPGPSPLAVPRPRPHLEVVPDPSVLRRRRLTRLATAVAGLAACFALFGVVSVHVLLAQGQADVQRLQTQVQQQEDHQQQLKLDVAALEAPGRIVATAEHQLGMVPPHAVVTLTPATLPPRP